ncbi:MAG: hypothetical protein UX10_C0015G0008 [Candidatus Magasanikbacteria bacterium GW2011_GWA2_45_39]|uniref:DUF3048 domain-containing protein n=2 Tax=Candidatus Magasanikiibacteriota TaxID=1752731 RepID=A0A0G1MY58_9BACT|nr:MAG: hypothetical protein UX10_C0015G0008 [Candidatus Magasanikbacteria bacterium GW2011_GWA2_45_39]KKU13311.1 MAG: hypothetical protein UX20_C0025G0011 [Candidatus Magasanikbacteria bacterium GW2011_GWC2_45_8]HBW74384.1 hypothetical protein [Candidatus Magasanikbacteria bacterium]
MFNAIHTFYKKKRRKIIPAAFLCVGLFFIWSVYVWGTAFGWWDRSISIATSVPVAVLNTNASTTIERFIDGSMVDPEMASGTLFAVMIDNSSEAQPPAGVENAPLVVEAPAEGGISRLLAFFLTGQTIDAIGPVRSARPYFIDFARIFNVLYAHVGGSPDALSRLDGRAWNVDEYSNGQYFWRSGKRGRPHNVFTSSEEMRRLAIKKYPVKAYQPIWFFEDEASPETRGGGSVMDINFGVTTVKWIYNKNENVYARSVYGVPHTTVDNNLLKAKNVVVITAPLRVIDAEGRLDIKTVGSGNALFLQNGNSLEGTWQRLSSNSALKFFDKSGNEMRLARGTVWVEVAGSGVVWSNN